MSAESIVQQFRHIGRKVTSDLERKLRDSTARDELYSYFQISSSDLEPELLRVMLDIEVAHYKSDDEDVDCDRLYWCAFLLSKCGRTQDVLPIWRAKKTDFDTGCGLDVQCVVGPGVDETLKYLAQSRDTDAPDALEYISGCCKTGDFDDMESWRIGRDQYFGSSR